MLCSRAQYDVFYWEVNALVMINNVWNSKSDKECLCEASYYGFSICRDICDLDLYLEYLQGKIFTRIFTTKVETLDKDLFCCIWLDPHPDNLQCPICIKIGIWVLLLSRIFSVQMTAWNVAICAGLKSHLLSGTYWGWKAATLYWAPSHMMML